MMEGPRKSWLGVVLGTISILIGLFHAFGSFVAIEPIALFLDLLYVAVGVGLIRRWRWPRWVAIPLVAATAGLWLVYY